MRAGRWAVFGLVAAAAVLLAPRAARADDWLAWRWAGGFEMSARYAVDSGPALDTGLDRTHQGVFGLAGRAMVGMPWLLFGAGVDTELGFEVPGGFVYGFHVLPVGLGLRPFGGRNLLGVMAGAGLGGAIDRVPFAWELPVEAFLELDLGRHVRVHLGARATWTPGTESREDGAASAEFTDQLDLRGGLSFGTRADDHYARWGDFDYFGVVYREQQGETFVGLVVALSIAAGSGDSGPRGL